MLWFPSFKGFEYSKLPIADAIQMVRDTPGYAVETLGPSSDGVNPIIGLRRENGSKPYIFIEGGIHGGHEWRTVYWVREFARLIANPEGPQYRLLKLLRESFSFYFVPCLNPYGYENGVRWNGNLKEHTFQNGETAIRGVDLNRNFDQFWDEYDPPEPGWGRKGDYPFSEVETQYIRDKVLELKPVFFADTHTWGSRTGATTYVTAPGKESLFPMAVRCVQNMKLVNGRTDIYYANPVNRRGQAHIWVAYQRSSLGLFPLTATPETGGGETEKEQARLGLNHLMLLCLYTYSWVYERNQRPTRLPA